jgi:hypothetical protein
MAHTTLKKYLRNIGRAYPCHPAKVGILAFVRTYYRTKSAKPPILQDQRLFKTASVLVETEGILLL